MQHAVNHNSPHMRPILRRTSASLFNSSLFRTSLTTPSLSSPLPNSLSRLLIMDSCPNSLRVSMKLMALAQQLRLYKPPLPSDDDEEEESAGKVVAQVGFPESATSVARQPAERFKPKRAAVLICLFEGDDGEFRVILTKRSSKLSTHSGEVSLPGGKAEETDANDAETATREAKEEIGLDPSLVNVVTCLEPFLSKHLLRVIPVIGILSNKKDFNPIPNAAEVEAVFDAPLEMFLKDENRRCSEGEWMGDKYLIHFFDYESSGKKYVIWGLTAGILIRAASIVYQKPPAFLEQTPKFRIPKTVQQDVMSRQRWKGMSSDNSRRSETLGEVAQGLRKFAPRCDLAVPDVTASAGEDKVVRFPPGAGLKRNRAAVLICLFEGKIGDIRVILTKRSATMSSHSGEVALPGGKWEEGDANDAETALREAKEEIGLDPSAVEVLTVLEPFYTKRNITVYPVIGILWDKNDFKPVPNATEVESVFDAPLEMFLKNENRREKKQELLGHKFVVQLFDYQAENEFYLIWALTAAILIKAASVVFQQPPDFEEGGPIFWGRSLI